MIDSDERRLARAVLSEAMIPVHRPRYREA